MQGLNSKRKQRILQKQITEEYPDIPMLQETKCGGVEAERNLS